MANFPKYPDIDFEDVPYALGYLQHSIKGLHDRLDRIPTYIGLCDDLRQIPIDLGNAIKQRRARLKSE